MRGKEENARGIINSTNECVHYIPVGSFFFLPPYIKSSIPFYIIPIPIYKTNFR